MILVYMLASIMVLLISGSHFQKKEWADAIITLIIGVVQLLMLIGASSGVLPY